ncbi:MAG: dipeptidyl-peptidase [Deltaproteobacteria bacterium RBG_16_71_12]|nr:MAG: dipeptidyl-peptidase [Deltaproteobacteria bacterium RBG_16_71_12]
MNKLLLAALACAALPAVADEGMWTYNNFPADKVAAKYQFKPDQAWLDKVRLGSARLAQGCSASFVSPDGLVLTNHHCAHSCIEQLSTKTKDFVKDGFVAKALADEKKCPELEVNQLTDITDVTKRVQGAVAGKSGAAFAEAQKAEFAKITKECATSDDVRCDVVTLYAGGAYNLYKYRRYQDVRLVFAPEFAIAFFGGDPDNFMFPRYDLDMALVRVYDGGKPLQAKTYLPVAKTGAKAGDLAFVSGHPGKTSRNATIAELSFIRDIEQPARLLRLAELRGRLTEFANRGKEQKRISNALLFYVENGYKARSGYWNALRDPAFFQSKVAEQDKLVASVKDPAKKAALQKSIASIAAAQKTKADIYVPYLQLEGMQAFMSDLFPIARRLVRAADELPLPNEKRLKGYTDADLPALKQMLFSEAPIYPELEGATLAFGLSKFREQLGPDHKTVKAVLGKKSPETLARELSKSKLRDVKERKKLFDGGKKAIEASTDPMIVLARAVDAEARALRKRFEDEVESVTNKESETIAKARFDAFGTSVYPDATFTLRLTFGAVEGWKEAGADVNPVTTMGGAFERHTGEDPFALPASWLKSKDKLDLKKGMNFVTTDDIIGGNSGSPVINQKGEVTGLIFDGNIHSLGGDYGFNPANNRAVAVHTDAILEALEKIYGAKHLADELTGAKKPTG